MYESEPLHPHYCDQCIFVKTIDKIDVWVCPNEHHQHTIILRRSGYEDDYTSMPWSPNDKWKWQITVAGWLQRELPSTSPRYLLPLIANLIKEDAQRWKHLSSMSETKNTRSMTKEE